MEMPCSSSNVTLIEEGKRVNSGSPSLNSAKFLSIKFYFTLQVKRVHFCNEIKASTTYTSHEHRSESELKFVATSATINHVKVLPAM